MIHPSIVLAVPVQCGIHALTQAGIWVVAGLIGLYCIIHVVHAHYKSKGSLLSTLGALVMAGFILWGTLFGGVSAMAQGITDSMHLAGFNSAPTDVSNPGGC